MRPEGKSQLLLAIARSKAKMFEYNVAEEHHIEIKRDPANLLTLSIGLVGDFSAKLNAQIVDSNYLVEQSPYLQFSAQFFDAYLQSHLKEELDPYLLLMGSASYYLGGFPGSSLVLAKQLNNYSPNLGCLGLEKLLLWLLQGNLLAGLGNVEGAYIDYIEGISTQLSNFLFRGDGQENLFTLCSKLRNEVYENGTSRQLLFTDVICAIVKKRIDNSTWISLPRYSEISIEQWSNTLQKKTFIRELWPAQHLLGIQGVFRGKSAVVQMPTSAGKTKATEIIIRSAFLSNRTSLAVIVAPFRALCHEIRNGLVQAFHNEGVKVDEMSDVLQADFEISELTEGRHILVITPEKLIYVLRHSSELAESINLLIYDEGHQFDSDSRGITYELLLTSLKSMVPEGAQTVLVSAVLSNADSIGNWLLGSDSEVVEGSTLVPTFRTIAFTSWLDRLGRLEFINPENPERNDFFVPRVIEQHNLLLRGKERNRKFFPKKNDSQSVALYLGLKLTNKGSVAIFCGRKSTASKLCEKILDAYEREIPMKMPKEYSNQSELERLNNLYEGNLGQESYLTKCASMGVLSHHGDIPQGIRLAVEHAMKEGLARFVICTSTLAQGVNLPIRYLIVTSVYQGIAPIKVRDFHNLIGRAGRAGMHTEGSILVADPGIYDKRTSSRRGRWRWNQYKVLLEPNNSEPCASTLLSLFDSIKSDDNRYYIEMEPLGLVQSYIDDLGNLYPLLNEIVSNNVENGFTAAGVENQIVWKLKIIESIESYLMSRWSDSESGFQEEDVVDLAKGTLAYFLSEEEQKQQIVDLFKLLAQNISQQISEDSKKKVYGKTLYGVWNSIGIENWVTEHLEDLISCQALDELLLTLWPLLEKNIRNKSIKNCSRPEIMPDIALEWIHGKPYHVIHEILVSSNAKLITGTKLRSYKVEHVVDICEKGFAFDGTLAIGAVAEILAIISSEENNNLIANLQELQKKMKYGVPTLSAIAFYEAGFADRVVSIDLNAVVNNSAINRYELKQVLQQNNQAIFDCLSKYPSYFLTVMNSLVA